MTAPAICFESDDEARAWDRFIVALIGMPPQTLAVFAAQSKTWTDVADAMLLERRKRMRCRHVHHVGHGPTLELVECARPVGHEGEHKP